MTICFLFPAFSTKTRRFPAIKKEEQAPDLLDGLIPPGEPDTSPPAPKDSAKPRSKPRESRQLKPVRPRRAEPAVPGPYAEIAVNQPVDQLYTYSISGFPDAIPGRLVEVPFGSRKVRGCIIRVHDSLPPGLEARRIRTISRIVSHEYTLEPDLVRLALWIADYYLSPPGDALGCVSFIGFNDVASRSVRYFELPEPAAGETSPSENDPSPRLGIRQAAVLHYLASRESPATLEDIHVATSASSATVQSLVTRGLVKEIREDIFRADDYGPLPTPDASLTLNEEQKTALDPIVEAMRDRRPETFLIHGVTGSGKTEIYLQAIELALSQGGSAIVLVPEIALTPQTVDRFRRRFGDAVGVYHSRLTIGQKFDLWKRIRKGGIRILTGARSAVFAPFPDLRVIVVDEEHETSYKQDSSPRYHARDVAILRATVASAVTILGSATPLVETYFKALNGKFHLLTLSSRIDGKQMPPVDVIDMTRELRDESNPGLFSTRLIKACEQALDAGDQVLLFMNRRGFFNFMVCLNCQETVKCHHCDSTLTWHKPLNRLLCHLCGREYMVPKQCPKCEGTDMTLVGYGTQRVEEYVEHLFPKSRVIRMDLDTTRKRNAFLDAWRSIEKGDVDVILGTQMIARGIHLERVTVVGVPLADVSLFQPDFRAAERAFSLLTQVSGRAGRGDRPGRVYIQTYVPWHYAIRFAREHDYLGFYQKEIRVRQVLRFPPHYRLMAVLLMGTDEEAVRELTAEFARILKSEAHRFGPKIAILGPAPAPVSKINDQYRWHIVIRSTTHETMKTIYQVAHHRFSQLPGKSRITIIPDIDPLDLL